MYAISMIFYKFIKETIILIYLISGASRSGKSKIANRLHQETGISYLPLDSVMMAFMHGVKEAGIHDKLWPHEIAKKLWGFLESFIYNLSYNEIDYIIEGEAMLPSLLSTLNHDILPFVKVVFIGYDQVDLDQKVIDCKSFSTGTKDWLMNEPETNITSHIRNMIGYSRDIKNECIKYHIPYFDTSLNFDNVIQNVVDFLKM